METGSFVRLQQSSHLTVLGNLEAKEESELSIYHFSSTCCVLGAVLGALLNPPNNTGREVVARPLYSGGN